MCAKKIDRLGSAPVLFLILAYPMIGMLWHHGYPLLSAEVLGIVAILAVASLLLALLLGHCRPLVSNLVLVALTTLAFMVNFNLLFVAFLLAALGLGVTALLFNEKFPSFLTVVLLALVVGAFFDSARDRAQRLHELPTSPVVSGDGPIIHIVLDAFIGPDGLPVEDEAAALRADLVEMFKKFGFQLFTRAYTHYNTTLDSMTRAFNFRNDNENIFQRIAVLRNPMSYPENAWFGALADVGRNIVVYQSDAMDFCSVNLDTELICNEYHLPNLITVHTDVESVGIRMKVLVDTVLGQSMIFKEFLNRNRGLKFWGVSDYHPGMLEKLLVDVKRQPDNVYFAHVMLPHAPFVYRQDCSLDYESESWTRFPVNSGRVGNWDETRRVRYGRYLNQARCAMRELERLFNGLEAQGLFETATILVHGDHGSLAYNYKPSASNMDNFSYRDLRETYSLLFAVKYPGEPFTLNDEVVSLNILMAQAISKITGKSFDELGVKVHSEAGPFVYLTDVEPFLRVNVDIFNESKAEVVMAESE